MTVIPAPFAWPFFIIFGWLNIADVTSIAGFLLDLSFSSFFFAIISFSTSPFFYTVHTLSSFDFRMSSSSFLIISAPAPNYQFSIFFLQHLYSLIVKFHSTLTCKWSEWTGRFQQVPIFLCLCEDSLLWLRWYFGNEDINFFIAIIPGR